MNLLSRENLKLVAVAVVCIAVSTTGPSLAAGAKHAVVNAAKVDGFKAVSASAPLSKRAGKLVATDRSGHLPNDIVTEAPNADLLDGKNSTDFLAATGKAADSTKLAGQDLGEVKTQWVFVGSSGTMVDHSAELTNVTVTHTANSGLYCVNIGQAFQDASLSGTVHSHVNAFENLGLNVISINNTSQRPDHIRVFTTSGGALADEGFVLTLALE